MAKAKQRKAKEHNLSHDIHGVLGLLGWILTLVLYYFFVIEPLDGNTDYLTLKKDPNLLKSYFFEAMPIGFLAVYLYYWDRKKYSSAYVACISPIIVPFTAWGFHGITEMLAILVYNLAL